MPLLGAILTWVGPIIGRILLALGFSVVTFTGFELMVGQLREQLIAAGAGLSLTVLQLFNLAGGNYCIAIIMGAINARVALWVATRSTRIIGTPTS